MGTMVPGRLLIALLFALTFCLPFPASAQNTTKRLILKDGSYQIVTKYEINGDRVHYFSAERNEWEDVPDALVDWKATNRFEADRLAGKESPEAIALDKEMEEEKQQDEAESPHVAPGLRLPPEGGVYALDTYLSQPELVPLDQNNGEVNRNIKKNVLRAAINPVSGSKHTVELAAPTSKIQIHASVPTIYINLDPLNQEDEPGGAASDPPLQKKSKDAKAQSAELPWDRFRIVRLQVKGDHRVVGMIKATVYGKVSQQEDVIPADDEQFGEGWIKITPKAPLEPGEYALAEMLGKEGMNSYVWDFGVHPDGPANLAVIRAEPAKQNATPGAKPELKKPDNGPN